MLQSAFMLSANRLEAEARSAPWDLRGMLAARPVSWRRHDEVSQQVSVGSRATTRDSNGLRNGLLYGEVKLGNKKFGLGSSTRGFLAFCL